MKKELKIVIKAFIYFTLVIGVCLTIVFYFYSTEIIKGFVLGFLSASCIGLIMSLYLIIGFTLFKKRWLFYKNIEHYLEEQNVRKVNFESVAGNASSGRIKYGALFLTDNAILFIPHRFAIKPAIIILPLKYIKCVKQTGVNLKKFFAGGLRNRLYIELENGEHYEFNVWEIDAWIHKIREFREHNT